MRQKPKPILPGSIWEVQAEFIMAQEGSHYYGSKYHRGTVKLEQGTRFLIEKCGSAKFWHVLVWGQRYSLPAFKIHKKCKEI